MEKTKIENIESIALTTEEERYLKERGFEVIIGEPAHNEKYPYLTLTAVDTEKVLDNKTVGYFKLYGNGGVKYFHTKNGSAGAFGKLHPSVHEAESLIPGLEKLVARCKVYDREDGLFQTKPGEPIRVFVVDPEWKDVAEQLADKYNT